MGTKSFIPSGGPFILGVNQHRSTADLFGNRQAPATGRQQELAPQTLSGASAVYGKPAQSKYPDLIAAQSSAKHFRHFGEGD